MSKGLGLRRFIELTLTLLDKLFLLFGTFFILKLLSIYADKEDFGLYSIGVSVYVIISMFPFTALDSAITRYYSIYHEQGRWHSALVSITFVFTILILGYSVLSFVIYYFPISLPLGLREAYFSIIFFSLIEIVRVSLLNIENAKRHRAINTFSNAFVYIGRCFIVFYLGKYQELTIGLLFIFFAIFSFINVLAIVFIQSNDFKKLFQVSWQAGRKYRRELLYFSSPMIIWGPFIWAQNMINRWLIEIFYNETTVAEFVAVNAIATLIPSAIFGVLWSLMTPILYRMENQEKGATRSMNRIIQPIFGLLLFSGFLISYLYSEKILLLAFGDQYTVGAWLLPILYIPAALIQWAAYAASELYAGLQTKKLLLPNIVPGLSSVVIGYILILSLPPLIAAAINAVITGIIYYCLMILVINSNRSK